MAITPQSLMRVINGLSGPLKTKAIKLLDKYVPKNVDPKGNVRNPLRKQSDKQDKSQKAVEGQRRYKVGEIKGIVKGIAGTSAVAATYSAGDLVNDLLGIKSMGKSTLKADGASGEYTRMPLKDKKPVEKKKVVKKTTPKAPPPKPDSVKKKKQLMMKEKYSGKDSEVQFNSKGGMMKKYNKGGMTKKGKK